MTLLVRWLLWLALLRGRKDTLGQDPLPPLHRVAGSAVADAVERLLQEPQSSHPLHERLGAGAGTWLQTTATEAVRATQAWNTLPESDCLQRFGSSL